MKSFALNAKDAKRLHEEEIEDNFLEDRSRVVSSNAFRRLEAKTQVFVANYGDHYRNRLTHSLEVAEIAKMICHKLELNTNLAESIALSHDLGHPCFGHSGEDVLNNIMKSYNLDYKHNTFSFKVLTKIETRSIEYKGLNLTLDVLDGILKHNGPILRPCQYIVDYNNKITDKDKKFNLLTYPSPEAQIANFADDIAYVNHDIEDGHRANIIKIQDIEALPIFKDIILDIKHKYSIFEESLMIKEIKRISIKIMINDIIKQTLENGSKIVNISQIYHHNDFVANFTPEMTNYIKQIKEFSRHKIYKNKKILKQRVKGASAISKIFETLLMHPELMDSKWFSDYNNSHTKEDKITTICDYIAGMTDTFAMNLARRFFYRKMIF